MSAKNTMLLQCHIASGHALLKRQQYESSCHHGSIMAVAEHMNSHFGYTVVPVKTQFFGAPSSQRAIGLVV